MSTIIIPATIFPKITDEQVFINPKFMHDAIHVPVHTPVNGNGIATNINKIHIFFNFAALDDLLSFLDLFIIKFSMALPIFEKCIFFFKRLIIGLYTRVKIGTINEQPNIDQPNPCHRDKLEFPQNISLIEKGIAPLISIIGTIDIIIVANTALFSKILAKKEYMFSII